MLVTAQSLEEDIKKNLSAMDAGMVYANKEAITARLYAMGMYGLARDMDTMSEGRSNAELLSRLYAAFGVELYGNVAIDELSCETVEFECIYGLTDEVSGAPGKLITFTARDKSGRFPVFLSPENIDISFSLNGGMPDNPALSCLVRSCVHDQKEQSTRVTLDVRISNEAFFTEGGFIMYINVRLGGASSASATVRFIVKNTFPTFFKEDFASAPLADRPRVKSVPAAKNVIHTKAVIQTRQKTTRITFDKRRGDGIPTVICSNGAFKASMISRTSVTVTFKLSLYKSIERKLMSAGINMRFPPETSVWVEWNDVIIIYNLQYKGFLMDNEKF